MSSSLDELLQFHSIRRVEPIVWSDVLKMIREDPKQISTSTLELALAVGLLHSETESVDNPETPCHLLEYPSIPGEVVSTILQITNYKVERPLQLIINASVNKLFLADDFRDLIRLSVKWLDGSFLDLLILFLTEHDEENIESTAMTVFDDICMKKTLSVVQIFPECATAMTYGMARMEISPRSHLHYGKNLDLSLAEFRQVLIQPVKESLRSEPSIENALQCAVYSGNKNWILDLFEHDGDVPLLEKEDVIKYGLLPIVIFSQHGDICRYLDIAKILIDFNPLALFHKDEVGNLPIHDACVIRDTNLGLDLIKLLVQEGVIRNFEDKKGGLLMPDQDGDYGLDILINHSFRNEKLGHDSVNFLFGGETPLFDHNEMVTHEIIHKAVQFNNNVAAVKQLLEFNPNALLQKNLFGNFPIHSTVTGTTLPLPKGASLIMMCNEFIKPRMLKLLIQEHNNRSGTATAMVKNNDGKTVLDFLLSYLLSIDESKIDQDQFPGFDFGRPFELIWECLDCIHQQILPLETPGIVYAALRTGIKGKRLVEIAKKYKPPSESDFEDRFTLHFAIEKRIMWNEGLAEIVEANFRQLSLRDKSNRLPIHIAIEHKCRETIAVLIEACPGSAEDIDSQTGLYPFAFAATESCQVESIYLLLTACPQLLVGGRGVKKRKT